MELLSPHLAVLKRLALRLTRNESDAEDLMQDVLLKLYQGQERVRQIEVLKPWLVRVMYHQFIDQKRHAKSGPIFLSVHQMASAGTDGNPEGDEMAIAWDQEDQAPGPEAVAYRDQLVGVVAEALQRLRPGQRALFLLHHYEGLTAPEIALQTGTPLNTVKSTLKRAHAGLRQDLQLARGRRAVRAADADETIAAATEVDVEVEVEAVAVAEVVPLQPPARARTGSRARRIPLQRLAQQTRTFLASVA